MTNFFGKLETFSLKEKRQITEAMVRDYIAEHPEVLGLGGDVFARDKERTQSAGGRLDLLLEHKNAKKRYVVEIQLGATDPDHILRSIEYWDWEQKIHNQYKHCAVLIAEEITGRFFNVISLFHGQLPLIAIKMTAAENADGKTCLLFQKILGEIKREADDADTVVGNFDREYWVKEVGEDPINFVEKIFDEIYRPIFPGWEFNYTKFYLGLKKDGKTKNFMRFAPGKKRLLIECFCDENTDYTAELENLGLETSYKNDDRYEFKIPIGADFQKFKAALVKGAQYAHGGDFPESDADKQQSGEQAE
jgi:hypothetical protein